MYGRKELFEIGKDFLDFLERNRIEIHGRPHSFVENIFTTSYWTYFQEHTKWKELPSFNDIKQELLRRNIVQSKNRTFQVPKPKSKTVEKKKMVSENSTSSTSATSQPAGANAGMTKKAKKRKPAKRLAVDQHIVFNKPSNDSQNLVIYERTKQEATRQNILSNDSQPMITAYERPNLETSGLAGFEKKREKDAKHFKLLSKGQDGEDIYEFFCPVCFSRTFIRQESDIAQHMLSNVHKFSELKRVLSDKRKTLITNKNGVIIEADFPTNEKGETMLELDKLEQKSVQLKVKNKAVADTVRLLKCGFLKNSRIFKLSDAKHVSRNHCSVIIPPGTDYLITVTANPRGIGNYIIPLAFEFLVEGRENSDFHIVRFISLKVTDETVVELQPKTKFKHPPRVVEHLSASETVKGLALPPLSADELEKELGLERYGVPNGTRHILNRGMQSTKGLTDSEDKELSSLRAMLKKGVDMEQYAKLFSSLMHFEEIQMEVDIRKYDMDKVTMEVFKDNKRFLLLKVPGLAEKRPSLLKGDHLYVRIYEQGGMSVGSKEYQGIIHEVRLEDIVLGFDESLVNRFLPNMMFNVRFTFNRLPLRLQHRACQLAEELSMEKVLFPKPETVCKMGTMHQVDSQYRFFDRQLETNAEQVQAVKHIVAGTSRPAPYLIFGPPGTGKTVTMVEAMKQVWKQFPNAHILGCAPSNTAADLITDRLLSDIPKNQILRLVASSRAWSSIPKKVQPVCNFDPNSKHYYYLKKDKLQKFRIIISTLVTAGRLASAIFPSGHFTHVFIDECGQAPEPESLIPISGVLDISPHVKDGGQVVLAGDPKQLGPVLRSPFAVRFGLDTSLLERYMTESEVYQKNGNQSAGQAVYDKRLITKLLINYRSHPSIMEVPNQMFYENELMMCADHVLRESLCQWQALPKKGFPVIFHSVVGQDLQEERSPSFFNPEEASLVLDYTRQLLGNTAAGVTIKPSDIGIISPYRKQVQKIKTLLKKSKASGIFVGSTEEFQGQERLVIIVSTVRSNPEYLALDRKFKLGFLRSPKRFNVAMTRAKALLIVIGNPYTLSRDDCWNRFIAFCKSNGGFTGADFTSEDEEFCDLAEKLSSFHLLNKQEMSEVISPEEAARIYNERPWKTKN